MSRANQLIREIKKWAVDRPEVRAAILFGSQAQKGQADPLSDIDLALFVTDPQALISDPSWAETFGPIWLRVGEALDTTFIEKVLYEDGMLVDFALHPVEDLAAMQEHLPEIMAPSYQILVDKDKAARRLPKPSGHPRTPARPTSEEYTQTLEAFWFDAIQLAKYLLRSELWRAKHLDWQLKQGLLEMMGWHARLVRGETHFTTREGKRLKQWTDPETYTSLMTVFGRFYPADSWRALEDTIKRFNSLSSEVAAALDADPRPELAQKFEAWLAEQRESAQ